MKEVVWFSTKLKSGFEMRLQTWAFVIWTRLIVVAPTLVMFYAAAKLISNLRVERQLTPP